VITTDFALSNSTCSGVPPQWTTLHADIAQRRGVLTRDEPH
jgi:hypothetical protein